MKSPQPKLLVIHSGIRLVVTIEVNYFFIIVIHELFAALEQLRETVVFIELALVNFETILFILVDLSKILVSDDNDVGFLVFDLNSLKRVLPGNDDSPVVFSHIFHQVLPHNHIVTFTHTVFDILVQNVSS